MNNLLEILRVRDREKFLSIGLNAISLEDIPTAGQNGRKESNIIKHFENCVIDKGLQYIENKALRQAVLNMFKNIPNHNTKNNIIFITKSALCYLIRSKTLNMFDPIIALYFKQHLAISTKHC